MVILLLWSHHTMRVLRYKFLNCIYNFDFDDLPPRSQNTAKQFSRKNCVFSFVKVCFWELFMSFHEIGHH